LKTHLYAENKEHELRKELQEKQVEYLDLDQAFSILDSDEDGIVRKEDLAQFFSSREKQNITEKEIDLLFNKYDRLKKTFITKEEFQQ